MPDHIRLIAAAQFVTSAIAVWYFWPDLSYPELPDLTQLTVSMCLSLIPALAGFLLLRGIRWVVWMFIGLIPLAAATAFIAMLGNAMRTVSRSGEPAEAMWLGVYIVVTLASTIAVFRFFSRKVEGVRS